MKLKKSRILPHAYDILCDATKAAIMHDLHQLQAPDLWHLRRRIKYEERLHRGAVDRNPYLKCLSHKGASPTFLYLTRIDLVEHCVLLCPATRVMTIVRLFFSDKSIFKNRTLFYGELVPLAQGDFSHAFLAEDLPVHCGQAMVHANLTLRLSVMYDLIHRFYMPDVATSSFALQVKKFFRVNEDTPVGADAVYGHVHQTLLRPFFMQFPVLALHTFAGGGAAKRPSTVAPMQQRRRQSSFDELRRSEENNKCIVSSSSNDNSHHEDACFYVRATVIPEVYELFLDEQSAYKKGSEAFSVAGIPDMATSLRMQRLLNESTSVARVRCNFDDNLQKWVPVEYLT